MNPSILYLIYVFIIIWTSIELIFGLTNHYSKTTTPVGLSHKNFMLGIRTLSFTLFGGTLLFVQLNTYPIMDNIYFICYL